MRFLLAELGYQDDGQDFVRLHEEFNRRLLQEARAGNRFIVVIDEAQNLAPEVLETVRLLSDFETPRAKLLQIILSGQPELATKLASAGLAQLRQRISIVNQLEPLPSWEVKNYVEHRLQIAGYEGDPLFLPEALAQIAEFTEGNPRNINNFCFNALSLAFALRQTTVDLAVVQEVISDLDIKKYVPATPAGPVDISQRRKGDASAASYPQSSTNPASLSPADAKAYMQQVAEKLRSWQESLDQHEGGREYPMQAGGSRPN
jgi:general secretion pathway protein A